MEKFKKWVYVVVVAVWPIVYMIGISYLKLMTDSKFPYYYVVAVKPTLSDVEVCAIGGYFILGALFAYVASGKKEYYKSKAVLIAHIVALLTMLLFFAQSVLHMSGMIEFNTIYVIFKGLGPLFERIPLKLIEEGARIAIPVGVAIVTAIRAIYLYRKKETIE